MYPIERQETIMKILDECKSVSVPELSKRLYICEATIRRDLAELERLGQLKRTHGGAIALQGLSDSPLRMRQGEQIQAKIKICQRAALLVKSGMTISIDGSSTCLRMLSFINKIRPLSVLTNSAASEFSDLENAAVILTGGILNRTTMTCLGSPAISAVENYMTDLSFISAKCVSIDGGATDTILDNSTIKQTLLSRSKTRVLMVDHTKFGKTAFVKICPLAEFDIIVTDVKPNDELMEYGEKNNVKIYY